MKKILLVFLMSVVIMSSLFSRDRDNFGKSIVDNQWICFANSFEDFDELVKNKEKWEDYVSKELNISFSQFDFLFSNVVNADAMQFLVDIEAFVNETAYVESKDVYVYVISEKVDSDSGETLSGYVILIYYKSQKTEPCFYIYYFS